MPTKRIVTFSLLVLLLTTAAAQGRMVAVSTSQADIRETPKINRYNLFLQVPLYYPLQVLVSKEGFLNVRDYRGQVGWVRSDDVDETRTVVVKVRQGNLRDGPGTDYPVTLRAESGVCFKVVRQNGSWVYLEHASGHRGWMHASLLWGL